MVSKFDNLVAKAEALCFEDKKMSEWMDSQMFSPFKYQSTHLADFT